MKKTILEIKNLKTYFTLDEGILKAVDGVDLRVGGKQTKGVIGESGCGKSVTAQSILRIVPKPGKIVDGEILLHREDKEPLNLVSLDQSGRSTPVDDLQGKIKLWQVYNGDNNPLWSDLVAGYESGIYMQDGFKVGTFIGATDEPAQSRRAGHLRELARGEFHLVARLAHLLHV